MHASFSEAGSHDFNDEGFIGASNMQNHMWTKRKLVLDLRSLKAPWTKKWIYIFLGSSRSSSLTSSARWSKEKHRPSSVNMDILYHIPALAPPPGVTPNFINPQSQALMVIVTSVLCLAFIIPISLLRFYTNLWIKKSLKADDSKYQ